MRAEELEQPREMILTEAAAAAPAPDAARAESLGRRLREAREKRGFSRAEAASRLRFPLRLIARLEDDDYEGLDQGLYLRGYLKSYAELVGLPAADAERTAAAHTRSVPLVATGTVSRSRYLFDRYSVSATYLILTALIVVPAVWLATHGGLEQNLARTTSLDAPSTALAVPPPAPLENAANGTEDNPQTRADTVAGDVQAAATPSPQEQMPVIASMTPFPTQSASAPPAATSDAETPPAPSSAAAHTLVLKLKSNSWVEITASDGEKLEYSLLPGGTERSYSSNKPLSVRLGNAEGAEVVADGRSVDLAPFRHANVASLRVFAGESGAETRSDF